MLVWTLRIIDFSKAGVMEATESTRVVRTRSVKYSAWAGALVTLVLAVMAIAAHRGNVGIGVLAVFMGGLSLRARIMGVHIRRDDIKVVGFVSSTTVPWTDVERFDVERFGRYPYVAHVVRKSDHRHVPIIAISAPAHPESRLEEFRLRVQGQVDELNDLLEQRSRPVQQSPPSDPTTLKGFLDQLR